MAANAIPTDELRVLTELNVVTEKRSSESCAPAR
jgi:hypothetical protein